jgi:sRNA-binding protein
MTDREAKIERTIGELLAAFPLAFSTEPQHIKPLGIGIKQHIFARCTLSHREVGDALRRYTGCLAYLRRIIEGTERVDLDGATNGNVTAKEATHAAEQTMKILAIAAGKPKDKIRLHASENRNSLPPPAMPDAPKIGPWRLGLADLRQAATARRIPMLTAPETAKN